MGQNGAVHQRDTGAMETERFIRDGTAINPVVTNAADTSVVVVEYDFEKVRDLGWT